MFTGIARMLWFFYRVIYTLLPATMFVICMYAFIHYNFIWNKMEVKESIQSVKINNVNSVDDKDLSLSGQFCYVRINTDQSTDVHNIGEKDIDVNVKIKDNKFLTFIKYLYTFFLNLSTSMQVFFTVLLIILIDVVVEAMVLRVTYRALNFQRVCDDMYKELRMQVIPYKARFSRSFSVFNLMEVRSLVTDGKVADRIEYLLAREFLFNNTWMLILISATFFLPHTLCTAIGYDDVVDPLVFVVAGFIASVVITSLSWNAIISTKKAEVYNHFSGDDNIPAQYRAEAFMDSRECQEAYYKWIEDESKHKMELRTLWKKRFFSRLIKKYQFAFNQDNTSHIDIENVKSIYDLEAEFSESATCVAAYKSWLKRMKKEKALRDKKYAILNISTVKEYEAICDQLKSELLSSLKDSNHNHVEELIIRAKLDKLKEDYAKNKKFKTQVEQLIEDLQKYLNDNNVTNAEYSAIKKYIDEISFLSKYYLYSKKTSFGKYRYDIINRIGNMLSRVLGWEKGKEKNIPKDEVLLRYGTDYDKEQVKVSRSRASIMFALFVCFSLSLVLITLINAFIIAGPFILIVGWFLSSYVIVGVVIYFVLGTAFGEYLDVEKTIYAYFIHEVNIKDEYSVLKPYNRVSPNATNSIIGSPEGDADDGGDDM